MTPRHIQRVKRVGMILTCTLILSALLVKASLAVYNDRNPNYQVRLLSPSQWGSKGGSLGCGAITETVTYRGFYSVHQISRPQPVPVGGGIPPQGSSPWEHGVTGKQLNDPTPDKLTREQLEALIRRDLKDPSHWVRGEALVRLSEQPDPKYRPTLLKCVKDPEARVRTLAVQAFGQLARREDLPLLISWLKDSDAQVRGAVEEQIHRITRLGVNPTPAVKRRLHQAADDETSGLEDSPGLLYKLGDDAEQGGDFARAESLYRKGLDSSKRTKGSSNPNFDDGATLCFQLAWLLHLQGCRGEARRFLQELKTDYRNKIVYAKDYPVPSTEADRSAADLARDLEKEFNAPLSIRMEPVQRNIERGKPWKLRLVLTNTSHEVKKVKLYPTPQGGWLTDPAPNFRWVPGGWPPVIERAKREPQWRSLRPGQRVEAVLDMASDDPVSAGLFRMDLFTEGECRGSDGKEWKGRLPALATAVRI